MNNKYFYIINANYFLPLFSQCLTARRPLLSVLTLLLPGSTDFGCLEMPLCITWPAGPRLKVLCLASCPASGSESRWRIMRYLSLSGRNKEKIVGFPHQKNNFCGYSRLVFIFSVPSLSRVVTDDVESEVWVVRRVVIVVRRVVTVKLLVSQSEDEEVGRVLPHQLPGPRPGRQHWGWNVRKGGAGLCHLEGWQARGRSSRQSSPYWVPAVLPLHSWTHWGGQPRPAARV